MRIKLSNVGIIDNCDVEFIPGLNLIIGASGSGKSTLMRCIYNLAVNEFSDSDISFGKNTMRIDVENGDNNIQYSRSIKAKGERCYYKVNGEHYVKLGRQPLSAVTDALKIGSIDINGDEINFNFNLQFSSPFLILGNQSTLYNVLTYRSTFDISSINDYYAADIRNNASEMAISEKMKERLESDLSSLTNQAEKLKDVEDVYSRYMQCKHNSEFIDELNSLLNSMKLKANFEKSLLTVDKLLNDVDRAISTVTNLEDISKYRNMSTTYSEVNKRIKGIASIINHQDAAINLIQIVAQLDKLLKSKKDMSVIANKISEYELCIESSSVLLSKEYIAYDIVKQLRMLHSKSKCDKAIAVLDKCDYNKICTVDNLIELSDKMALLSVSNKAIAKVDRSINGVHKKLSEFDVCPLCGNSVHF